MSLGAVTTQPSGDGIYSAALENNRAYGRAGVRLYPYCEDGSCGFSLRVWGWEVFRPIVTGGLPRNETWIPTLLAELYCQAGNAVAGPPARRVDIPPGFDNVMLDSEYFAEQIDVIRGDATASAFQVGDGFASRAVVSLFGVQLFQFDFYHENAVPIGMNCFFGMA